MSNNVAPEAGSSKTVRSQAGAWERENLKSQISFQQWRSRTSFLRVVSPILIVLVNSIDVCSILLGQEKPNPAPVIQVPAGINDGFLDPNLNVDEWQKRFEVESREVYSCRKSILAALELTPGKSVADIGAGTGLYTQPMSAAVGKEGRVYAVDISPAFVKHLRKMADDQKLTNVEVVHCDDRKTGLSSESVDVVFVCDTYHHFEHPQETLKSIRAAIKPGGMLVVVDFDRVEGKSREWTMTHVRAGKEVFKREIEDAGFKLIDEVAIEGFKENYLLRFRK